MDGGGVPTTAATIGDITGDMTAGNAKRVTHGHGSGVQQHHRRQRQSWATSPAI